MFSAAAITSCGVTPEQAAEYNDKIIHEQKAVDEKEIALKDAIYDWTNVDGMKKAYAAYMAQVTTSIDVVKKLEKFDGSTSFADAAAKLFDSYKSYGDKEYKDWIDLYSLPEGSFTATEEDKVKELKETVNSGLDLEFEKFKLAQDAFAAKYKLELTQKDI